MRKGIWIAALLLGLVLNSSLADAKTLAEKFNSVQYGMSKDQVLDILGGFSIFGKPYKVVKHSYGDTYIWGDDSGVVEVQFTAGTPAVIRKTLRRSDADGK